MKRIHLITILFLSCFAIVLTGCKPGGSGALAQHQNLRNFDIEFSAEAGDTEITVVSESQGCGGSPGTNKGCVQFEKNETGTIEFLLNKSQSGRTCNTMPKADWVITKVELSAKGDSETGKGEFPKKPPGWLKNAFPGINKDNGLIFESKSSEASLSAEIIDLNNHWHWLKDTRELYYQITATSCADELRTIDIDPSVRNRGK